MSWFQNLFDARRKIAAWRKKYNEERPPSSLKYRTPQEFAALASKNQGELFVADAGQEVSIASPLPETPSGWRFAPIPAEPGDGVEFRIPK